MKKNLKISLTMLLIMCSILSVSSSVLANTFTSYIDMAPNTILEGNKYDFTEGTYGISIYPNSFDSFSYCDVYIDLYRKDLIGKTFLAGDEEAMSPTNQTYTFYRGYHESCKAFYYFKLVHGGLRANPVYLFSN